MSRPEPEQGSDLSPVERAMLATPNWSLALGVALVLGSIAIAAAVVLDLELPAREVKIVAIVALMGLGWSGPLYREIRSLIQPEKWGSVLVELDAEDPDGARVIGYRPGGWHVEVVEDAIEWTSPRLAFAEKVDLVDDGPDQAVGSWYGSASGRELLAEKGKIAEVRGRLEDDAKRGFVLDSAVGSIVRSATMDATREVVEVVDELSLPDQGEGISNAVDDALERFGLGNESETSDDHREDDAGTPDNDATPGVGASDTTEDGPTSVPHPADAGGSDD